VFGVMGSQGSAQHWQLLVGLEPAEALDGLHHAGSGPAQCHLGIAPAFDVPADLPNRAVHVFNDVGARQRPAQFDWQAEAGDGEDFVNALQDTGADAGCLAFQAASEITDQLFRLLGIIEFPRLTQRLAHAGMQGFGEALGDVAGFVNLAALDRGMAAEGLADRPGQRLGSIDDEKAADRRIKTAADQIVQESLHYDSILGCPFNHAQRVLVAGAVDADGAHQHQVVVHVHTVDLDDQQVQQWRNRSEFPRRIDCRRDGGKSGSICSPSPRRGEARS